MYGEWPYSFSATYLCIRNNIHSLIRNLVSVKNGDQVRDKPVVKYESMVKLCVV